MDYELAKQLKEAGLPLRDSAYVNGGIFFERVAIGEKYYIIPTLSELIEACGDGFETLNKGSWMGKGDWLAYKNYFDEESFVSRPKEPVGIGKTPKEAVARLWIKLNKK